MLLLCAMVFAFAACSPDNSGFVPEPEEPECNGDWLSVSLRMPTTASRAKESHPDEPAVNHESDVENLTIFIYSSGDGLNAPSNALILESKYITKDKFISDETVSNGQNGVDRIITVKFQTQSYKLQVGDRIAVVANMGDLSRFTTLGQLQNYVPERTWLASSRIEDYTQFTMASASNEDGYARAASGSTDPGSAESPYEAFISIERTAARIDLGHDLGHDGGTWRQDQGENFMVYTARDKAGKAVGTVYVSHVLPFNVMQQPSYALKRISRTATDNMSCFSMWTYTGTLPKDYGGKPTAYVIEPQTASKTGPEGLREKWFGNTRAGLIAEQGKDYFKDKPRLAVNTSEKYTILCYANENTAHVNHTTADNLTGIVIRAQYVPAQLHHNVGLTNPYTNVARGTDIWRYMPRNSSTEESNVLYFSTEELANAYRNAHPEDLASVTYFEKGECFYHLWLKHTLLDKEDSMPRPTFPMEYGIVRNHIYRVSLIFRGIGRQGVTVDDPYNVQMTIFVRPWRFFTHDTIIM